MFKGCIKGVVVCNCLWGFMSGYVEGMKEAFYDVVLAQSTLEVNESLQVDEKRFFYICSAKASGAAPGL